MTTGGSLNFDRIADRYDETRGGERRGEQFASDLKPMLRADRPVLEIGVGTGIMAQALTGLGVRVFGVDISEQMLGRARQRIGSRVARGDAMHLPVGTAVVDQVLCVWVLHAVADAASVLREAARVLRPGGVCLVMDHKAMFDPSHPVDAAYREIEEGLGLAPRIGRAHEYAQLAPEARFRVVDIVTAGPHRFERSIADVVRTFETRVHSWMWDVPDDLWERVSAPVISRLRTLPDIDRRVPEDGYQEILVLER